MSLLQKHNRLSAWGKFGAISSVASVIGIPLSFYLSSTPLPQVQQTTAGDNITQISNVQGWARLYHAHTVNRIYFRVGTNNVPTLPAYHYYSTCRCKNRQQVVLMSNSV